MSEQAPERRRDNAFTRRIGPLPMWQWLLIALAMVGIYVIFQYRKNNQQAASAANSAAGTSTGGTTGAGQVPQFVNQTYTYVAPPAAQPPPPSAHGSKPPPQPAPAPAPAPGPAPLSMPPASQGTIAATAPNIQKKTLSAAIAALQQAGWGINTVSYAGKIIPSSQYAQYAGTTIWSYTPLPGNKVNIGLQ